VELGLNLPAVRRRIERGVRGEALLDPVREHISHKMGMKNMREHEARIRLEKEKAEPRLVMF
jgi:hypothetical protein